MFFERLFFPAPRNLTVSGLGVRITSAAALGNKIRLGIYSAGNSRQYPGKLLFASAELPIDNTGLVEESGLNLLLSGGTMYWLAYVSSATATYNVVTPANQVNVIGHNPLTNVNPQGWRGWEVAYNYAALPDIFPAGGTLFDTGTVAILVQLK